MRLSLLAGGALALAGMFSAPAMADIVIFTGADGLSAEAEFTLINATTLQVVPALVDRVRFANAPWGSRP